MQLYDSFYRILLINMTRVLFRLSCVLKIEAPPNPRAKIGAPSLPKRCAKNQNTTLTFYLFTHALWSKLCRNFKENHKPRRMVQTIFFAKFLKKRYSFNIFIMFRKPIIPITAEAI